MKCLRGIWNFDSAAFACLSNVIVFSSVNICVDQVRLKTNEFHDIDFAARRPADLCGVGSKRPDSRPGATAGREFGPDLDSAVSPTRLVARGQAGRGVIGKFAISSSAAGRGSRVKGGIFV